MMERVTRGKSATDRGARARIRRFGHDVRRFASDPLGRKRRHSRWARLRFWAG